jgi:PAS domain S-box-containing protein
MAEIPDTDGALRIQEVLKDHPHGLSIKEISTSVGMSRNSVAKYLEVLTATGRLEVRHVGNAKLFSLSQRMPVESVLHFTREIIIVLNHNLQIVQASDSLCTFTGSPRESILHTRLSAHPVALLSPVEENELTRLLGGGESWKKEIRVVRQGTEVFLEGRFIPTILDNGDPGVTVILENTTERRAAEKAMQGRERLLHTIFQIPAVPRFFIDRNHKVVFWDRALEIMSGIKSEEVVGTSRHWRIFFTEAQPCLSDLLVDGDLERMHELFGGKCRKIPSDGGGYELVWFFPGSGDAGKWLHVTATLMRDSAGHVTGAMETLEDVTDTKKRDFVVQKPVSSPGT